jgi:opacity protein-like surface antigen
VEARHDADHDHASNNVAVRERQCLTRAGRRIMHRFFGRAVMAGGALLIAATAQAQNSGGVGRSYKFGGDLGASMPLGDFGDAANAGYHIGGLFEYTPKSMPVSWRGEIAYNRNGLKDSGIDGLDGNFSMLNLVGNAVMPFGDKAASIRPYAIGGLGIYRVKASAEFDGVTASQSDTKMGLNAGAGLSFHLSGFESFVETRFNSVFTDGSNMNFMPFTFGIKF